MDNETAQQIVQQAIAAKAKAGCQLNSTMRGEPLGEFVNMAKDTLSPETRSLTAEECQRNNAIDLVEMLTNLGERS